MAIILITVGAVLITIFLFEINKQNRISAENRLQILDLRLDWAESRYEIENLYKDVCAELDKCKHIDIRVYLVGMKNLLKSKLNEL